MSGHTKRASSVRLVACCVAALLLFDLGFNLARGSTVPLGYWLLIALASLALAAAAGALAAACGWRGRGALALWLALEGLAWSSGGAGRSLLVAAVFGLLTWAALGLRPRRPGGLPAAALIVACAFGMATLVWPRVAPTLGIGARAGLAEVLWTLGVYAGALVALSLASRVAAGRRPLAGWPAVAVMLVALVGAHLAYSRARPRQALRAADGAPAGVAGGPASIIVLVLDTARADALTLYGSELDTTPRLRRFVDQSERAVVYPWAFAPSNWTIPSHASLFTGLLPSEHGAHEGAGGLRGSPFSVVRLRAETTLAEALRAAGYRTAFLTANPTLLRVRGLERGFDVVRQPPPPRASSLLAERLRRELAPSLLAGSVGETPKAERVAAELLAFAAGGPEPYFAVANFMEPHTPYRPPWPEAGLFGGRRFGPAPEEVLAADPPGRVELARRSYLEEIRALDRQLGGLLDELAAAGHLDRAWLVITSDHGEAFLEHGGTNHGGDVYNEQVRIPLIVQPPRGTPAPAAVAPVGLVDVATTLAAVGGLRGFGRGRDLTAAAPAVSPAVVEFFGGGSGSLKYHPAGDQPAAAVVLGGLKLIRRGGREELYDLAVDPGELADRSGERQADAARLRGELPELRLDAAARGAEEELSYEELEALRDLGYLD